MPRTGSQNPHGPNHRQSGAASQDILPSAYTKTVLVLNLTPVLLPYDTPDSAGTVNQD